VIPPQNLEQHFREPVLARIEDRKLDVGERPAEVFGERWLRPRGGVIEGVGRARSAALDGDPLA